MEFVHLEDMDIETSYHEFYRIYGTDTYEDKVSPEIIITEDSNSGYQFFEHVCIENGLKCESMNGKSNVFHYLNKHKGGKNTCHCRWGGIWFRD